MDDFADLENFYADQDELSNLEMGQHQYSHRENDFADYFGSVTDSNFRKRYRMSKSSFNLLCNDLNLPAKHRGNYIDPRVDVLCFLRYLCTGSFMEVSGDLLHISKASAHRAVHRVMLLIASLSDKYIKFPDDTTAIKQDFFDLYGFPFVVGAIDCTHVQIQSVGGNLSEVFRNRKGVFSINVQCVCDPKMSFIDVVCRWRGSTHDSRILENSNISSRFENNEINGILLGDAGYPLKTWLMTPLSNPTSVPEKSNI